MASTAGQAVPINGFDMYYEVRGAGAPLLLLHGGSGAGANWDLVFDEPPAGHQLIVPDLRGHGRSTNPSGEFTFRQCAEDVVALLDHLGVAAVNAIGVSLGAKTLLHVGTAYSGRVDAMVLASATPYFPEPARAIMRRMTPDNRSPGEWERMRRWHTHGDDQIRALWRIAHELKDSYEDMSFTPPHLSTITARTLIVHGDRDPLYPVSLALEMYQAIPRAYLWIVPNGGHSPIFGDRAVRFRETSLAFLRGEWERR